MVCDRVCVYVCVSCMTRVYDDFVHISEKKFRYRSLSRPRRTRASTSGTTRKRRVQWTWWNADVRALFPVPNVPPPLRRYSCCWPADVSIRSSTKSNVCHEFLSLTLKCLSCATVSMTRLRYKCFSFFFFFLNHLIGWQSRTEFTTNDVRRVIRCNFSVDFLDISAHWISSNSIFSLKICRVSPTKNSPRAEFFVERIWTLNDDSSTVIRVRVNSLFQRIANLDVLWALLVDRIFFFRINAQDEKQKLVFHRHTKRQTFAVRWQAEARPWITPRSTFKVQNGGTRSDRRNERKRSSHVARGRRERTIVANDDGCRSDGIGSRRKDRTRDREQSSYQRRVLGDWRYQPSVKKENE